MYFDLARWTDGETRLVSGKAERASGDREIFYWAAKSLYSLNLAIIEVVTIDDIIAMVLINTFCFGIYLKYYDFNLLQVEFYSRVREGIVEDYRFLLWIIAINSSFHI